MRLPWSMERPAGVSDAYWDRYLFAVQHISVAAQWVTPQLAQEWLNNFNTKNRPLGVSWRRLCNKINAGLWQFNAETIVFSSEGKLLNGQHRLTAIIASAQPVPVLVVYGVTPDAFTSYDQAKSRSRADTLALDKHRNCTTLASAINWVMRYEARAMTKAWEPPHNEELLNNLDSYMDILDSLDVVKGQWAKYKTVQPGLLTAVRAILTQEDPAASQVFFERVVEGLNNEKESWEYMLNRRLIDMQGRSTVPDQVEKAALIFKAWKAIRDNKTPGRTLIWKRSAGEPFPYLWEPDQESI